MATATGLCYQYTYNNTSLFKSDSISVNVHMQIRPTDKICKRTAKQMNCLISMNKYLNRNPI